MPPRRSCFRQAIDDALRELPRFNATTAFLLLIWLMVLLIPVLMFQCHHGVPASWESLRMRAERLLFQCHHGVPASCCGRRGGRGPGGVSMPPRRSCFPVSARRVQAGLGFQCHHGVPASPGGPPPRPRALPFQCHHGVPASRGLARRSSPPHSVSMPPRRSCFIEEGQEAPRRLRRFNATTAFLLPTSIQSTRSAE